MGVRCAPTSDFQTTKLPELRFRALLNENATEVELALVKGIAYIYALLAKGEKMPL
jgi:hypothetical protein